MNTLHFKYAIEVERTRSITQAAENLFMGQPNLSKAIKELEDTLGFTIFQRTSKGVVPTEKGSEFLVYARNVMAQLEKMEALSQESSAGTQRLNVSIPHSSYIAGAVTDFVASLDPEKPVRVRMQEAGALQTIAGIADGRFDLGVIRVDVEFEPYFLDYMAEKQLAYEPLWTFARLVLFSGRHPLAEKPVLSPEDLAPYTEIVHGDEGVPYLSGTAGRKTAGGNQVMVYGRGSQFDLLDRVPGMYMWESPVPELWLRRFGLVQRSCPGGASLYRDLVVYPKGYKFSPLERMFIDCLFRAKNDVALREYG